MFLTTFHRAFAVCIIALVLAQPLSAALMQSSEPGPDVITTGGAGARIHAQPNSSSNAVVFRVRNTGTATATYQLACTATGVLSDCRLSQPTVEVAPGQFVRAAVRYSTGTPGTGRITLKAAESTESGQRTSSAAYDVDVLNSATGTEQFPSGRGPSLRAEDSRSAVYSFDLMNSASAPQVFISPSGGTFTAAGLDVMVEWCSFGYALSPTTRTITFNGSNVTSTFSYGWWDCAQYAAVSLGQVTLVSGSNSLAASIRNGSGVYGNASAQYTLSAPATPSAPIVSLSPNPGTRLVRSACVTAGSGPAGAFQCGDLLVAHSMPAYRTFDRDRTMTLLYNSATAKPYSIIMADVSLGSGISTPDRIDVSVYANGATRASYSFSSAGLTGGGPARRIAVGFDPVAAGMGTGVHPYTAYISTVYGSTPYTTTVSGDIIVIDQRSSPYGAGWNIAGVEYLVGGQRNSALLLVGGDGSALVYENISSNKWLAPAGAYRDTIEYGLTYDGSVPSDTSYYWRRALDGTRTFFNAAGALAHVVDRLGNRVAYAHVNAANPNSGLSYVRISPYDADKRYNFAYSGGKLSTITGPAARVLTATMSNGQLISIRDSANDAHSTSFSYDNTQNHRLIKRTTRRGFATAYRYYDNPSFGATGLLVADSLPITTTLNSSTFRPVQRNGLASQSSGNASATTDTSYITIDGPRTDQADIVRFLVNGDQAPVKIIDPMSAATYIRYAASAPLLPDSITYANGNVVRMRYDSRARLEWTQTSNFNGGRDSTTFAYQGTVPDQPSQVSVPLNGTNRLTGSFSYNSNGTLHQSTDPRGQVTTYAYNSRGQVDAVTMASVPVFVSSAQPRVVSNLVTRFYYNSLANTDSVKSDQGRVTHLQYDAYGNVIVRANPLQKDSFVYNALNQQIAMVQRDGSTTFPTTMQYNPDGALTVRTDPRSVVRQWEYDGSGRDTAEVDEFSKRAIKRYDPAGNVIVTISRQGDQTSSTYDAGGRLEQTIMNEVRVDNAADETLYRESINTVLVPADTLKYEYGVPGTTLVTRAANRNAVIRRTYSVEGALLTEMDSVKFINPVQVHTKTYTYNAAGARQSFTTPAARSISYNFSTHGDLSSIGSPAGSSVFAWHALGGRDSLYLPDGTATKYRYDSDGLLRTLYAYHPVSSPVNGYKGIVDQAFYYDAAGRPDSMIDRSITAQGGSGDKSIFTYDGRGQIKTHSAPSGTTTYSYDASGNRVTETSAAGTFTHNIAALTNRISTRSEPLGTRYYRYDGNGGVVSDSTKQPVSNIGPSNWYSRSVRTFYDAAGRATIIKMDSIAYNSSQQMISTFSPAALDYRYDALGRALLRQDGTGGQIPVVPDGDNLVALGSANPVEIVSAPGIDEPLMLLPPSGQGICGYSAAYFITYRGRLYDYHRPNGTSCIEAGNVGWETYGRNAGPIANSHSFGMARAQGRNGLSFFRNRLYDSNSGRFTQEDPIGFDGGDNLYAYGDNNPAALTDAFGLSATATQDTIYTRWKRPRIDMSDPGRQRMRAALPSTPHVSYMACLGQIGSTAFSIAVDASVLLGVGAGVKGMQFGWTMGREAMKAYGSHALGLATLGQRAQATASVGRATGRVLVAEGQAGFGAAAANAEFSWSRALAPFVPGWNSISTAADVPAACSSR